MTCARLERFPSKTMCVCDWWEYQPVASLFYADWIFSPARLRLCASSLTVFEPIRLNERLHFLTGSISFTPCTCCPRAVLSVCTAPSHLQRCWKFGPAVVRCFPLDATKPIKLMNDPSYQHNLINNRTEKITQRGVEQGSGWRAASRIEPTNFLPLRSFLRRILHISDRTLMASLRLWCGRLNIYLGTFFPTSLSSAVPPQAYQSYIFDRATRFVLDFSSGAR